MPQAGPIDLSLHSRHRREITGRGAQPGRAGASLCGSRATHSVGPGRAGSTSSLDGMLLCGQQEAGHRDETAAPNSVARNSHLGQSWGKRATTPPHTLLPGSN